jgi:hypothetical protein
MDNFFHAEDNKKCRKNAEKFICEKCDFTCSKLSNWNTHISTRKHKMVTDGNNYHKNADDHYQCECGKIFKFPSGISRHKKKCQSTIPESEIVLVETTPIVVKNNSSNELMLEILRQNNDFKNILVEQNTKIIEQSNKIIEMTSKQSVITNNTTNNTQFNLNLFLNETCKDALNIVDFMNNLKLEITDLENVGHNGYIEGITNIIMKSLNTIEVNKRPIHCTDLKRETMYIRDNNEWNKDNSEKTKLRTFIGRVADKNLRQLQQWRELNPECNDPQHHKFDFCIDMYQNALGGYGDEEQNKFDDQIIKNIAKRVLVDKNKT